MATSKKGKQGGSVSDSRKVANAQKTNPNKFPSATNVRTNSPGSGNKTSGGGKL